MSDTPQGPGWWQASDDKWYPPPRPEMPGEGAAQPPLAPPSDPSNPYGAPGAPPPGMPPSGSGPYGAPPPVQHSNRTAIFVGAGIAGALVLLLVLFLVIGGDDDSSDEDPELTGDTSEQTDDTTDETLQPDDQQTQDTAQVDTTEATDDGGDDSGGGSGGTGSGELPSSYSSTDPIDLGNGLVVVEHGFSSQADEYDDANVNATYGVIIENTGDTLQEDVTLVVTAKGADGSALGSENHEVAFVEAGETMAIGNQLSGIDGTFDAIAELEINFGGSSDGGSIGDGDVEFTSITTTSSSSTTEITFSAQNNYNYELTYPEVTTILRDTDGGIIGGDTSIIALPDVPAGSGSGGEMTFWMPMDDVGIDPDGTEMWVFYSP